MEKLLIIVGIVSNLNIIICIIWLLTCNQNHAETPAYLYWMRRIVFSLIGSSVLFHFIPSQEGCDYTDVAFKLGVSLAFLWRVLFFKSLRARQL